MGYFLLDLVGDHARVSHDEEVSLAQLDIRDLNLQLEHDHLVVLLVEDDLDFGGGGLQGRHAVAVAAGKVLLAQQENLPHRVDGKVPETVVKC